MSSLTIRDVPADTAERFRRNAKGRGIKQADYLARLVELHTVARMLADNGDEQLAAELKGLGLQTVAM